MDHGTEARMFRDFAGRSDAYYASAISRLQRNRLPFWHVNWSAAAGGFLWAATRANGFLFWIGFALDLVAAVCLALAYKYAGAAEQAVIDEKQFLVTRFEAWEVSSFWAAILVFVIGRLLFGWLADRVYARQYERWRIDHGRPSGLRYSRLLPALLALLLIWPLTLYRATQFAPEPRACQRQDRALQDGESVAFKDRFNCLAIGDFPTLFWLDRPDEISFPRNEDGTRNLVRKPAGENLPPVDLNTFISQHIEDSVGYLTAFYGIFFDSFTAFLRAMLGIITAVFVGTPWPVTAGVLLAVAYRWAGGRVAAFVGASLAYLALFGFWNTAMDTLSLVVAASIICILVGLPLGIWIAKSSLVRSIATPVLDVMQTIPSFVYLLPAVAFFSIGKPPGILATVIFAMPPMARLTALGIRQVPENTREAALAFGATPRQLLTKVELPLALPSIMAGVNQVVMMSLSMVVIAALIGAGGMGFVVTEALSNTRIGRGILAGFGIALLAMMIDRVIQKARRPQR
ncbi:proline/glycine betaine ABC transporter permease [Shinella daejeonensis]|uniref:ABC transporter permease n=1 Tax=Shinella daejeonensis TaxID=659017 RepID=UPI0020C7FF02|nr:proline/glycine betaine ABC transporter permease [Shinella daejeonensis]MCP8894158.1 proline/glycine betaine ABC transporter permease [Shinella daejeonensis]